MHALILPALSLSLGEIAILTRVTRSAMLDTLREDYVRTARAKGAPERVVLFRHALRNALIPVTTVAGLIAGFLVAGAVIIESVFRLPGVGQLVYDFDQQPRPGRDQERGHPVHDPGADRQPAGRPRLCAARSPAAGAGMSAFLARASRHVGFQIGAVLLLLFVGTALVSLALDALSDRRARTCAPSCMPSSAAYPLGTDHLGRDVLSRIMVGAQTSITVGLIAVAIGLTIGVALGAWAAARGGWVDEALSRTSDLIFAFPAVLIAILITSVLGASAQNAILAIAIFNIPVFARVTRGAALAMWSRDFIRAATAMGQGPVGITLRHVLPNIASVLIVQATIQFAVAILAEAGLSYLGLGAQPPVPSWGRMLRDAQTYIFQAPELARLARAWPSRSRCSASTCWATACATFWTRGCACCVSDNGADLPAGGCHHQGGDAFCGIHRFAAWLLVAVTLANALNSFALCGPVECADDPAGYWIAKYLP